MAQRRTSWVRGEREGSEGGATRARCGSEDEMKGRNVHESVGMM